MLPIAAAGIFIGPTLANATDWPPRPFSMTSEAADGVREHRLYLAEAKPADRSGKASAARSRTVTRPHKGNALQARIDALSEENRALKADLASLNAASKGSTGATVQELERQVQQLGTELMAIRQTSANALQIQAERDHLHESVIRLERELEAMKRAKQSLDADSRQNWFLIGAGVLLGGLVLGLIIPQLSWRRRSNWDSF
jgi:SH3 domain protein